MWPSLKRWFDSLIREDRIYIFFTLRGPYYIGFLMALISISFSYGNSLAYSATFVFFSILMVSAVKTNYNLHLVRIEKVWQKGYFPEESPSVEFVVKNHSSHYRFDLFLEKKERKTITFSLRPYKSLNTILSLEFPPGCYDLGRVNIRTRFPFEIMHSWKVFKFKEMIYIFPNRVNHLPHILPLGEDVSKESLLNESSRGEDFFSHRPFVEGDSLRFFDWKIYAREGGSLIKTFEEKKGGPFEIRTENLQTLNQKQRGEQIAYWLDRAVKEQREFSLDLSGLHLKKGSGKEGLKLFLKKYLEWEKNE